MKQYHFSEITSTNDYARELLDEYEIICVTALNQTKGRGRNQNQWFGSFGNNLFISFGISHNESISIEKIASYQSLGSLCVLEVLKDITTNIPIAIKYPNDIYLKDKGSWKKISGILIEHGFAGSNCIYTIVGIGLNVNENKFPPNLEQISSSLKLIGYNFRIEEIQNKLIEKFSLLLKINEKDIYEIWKKELQIIGKEIDLVKSDKEISGKANTRFIAKELMEDGRLVIENEKQCVIIDNGDSIRYDLG